jgi:hypothetical protein
MDDIGFQDGIESFEQWFRKMAVAIENHNQWVISYAAWAHGPRTEAPPLPPSMPVIPLEGPRYKEADISTWPWPKKFFDNTMRKLKDSFDAANPNPGGGTTEPPPPAGVDKTIHPPLAYSEGVTGEPSARYNIRINCVPANDGTPDVLDKQGIRYDDGGRNRDGRRQTRFVAGLKRADMMDGKEPWEPYEWMGHDYPPYPDDCWKL